MDVKIIVRFMIHKFCIALLNQKLWNYLTVYQSPA